MLSQALEEGMVKLLISYHKLPLKIKKKLTFLLCYKYSLYDNDTLIMETYSISKIRKYINDKIDKDSKETEWL